MTSMAKLVTSQLNGSLAHTHVHSILPEDFVYTKLPSPWILFVTSQINTLGAFLVTCEHA